MRISKRVKLLVRFSVFFFSILISHISYLKTAKGQAFNELHSFSFYADSITNYSSTWMDIDQDYDYDLLSFSILNKTNQLYISDKNTLKKTTSIFQKDGGNANGACYADIDLDGDLDIFVYSIFGQKNYLYIQESKGQFRKENFMDIVSTENNAFYACFSDVDLDNDPDLILTDTELWNPKSVKKPTRIYYNDGKGNFSKEEILSFYVPKSDTRSVLLTDFNQDGREDLMLVNFGSENEVYLKNEGNIYNKITTNISINKGDYMDAISADIDNDGDADVFVATVKNGVDLYRNEGHLLFTKFENIFKLENFNIAGIEPADYNNDGRIDIIIHKSFSADKKIFINNSKAQNYLNFKLRADRANINGIQTKVYVNTTVDGRNYWLYKEVRATKHSSIANAFDVHFGVGDMEKIDSVKIIWPDGTIQYSHNLISNNTYFVEQRVSPKIIYKEYLLTNQPQAVRNSSISVVSDYFRIGEISGITIFYENNGLVEEDMEVDLKLSEPMALFNSFPMPQTNTNKDFHWTIKSVPPKFRGIITLSVRTPTENELSAHQQTINASVTPLIGDESGGDNEVELVRDIK